MKRRRKRNCPCNPPRRRMRNRRARRYRGYGSGTRRFRQFWGVAPERKTAFRLPGPSRNVTVVGLGQSPAVTLANGPEGRSTKVRRIRHRGYLVAHGKRLMILSGRNSTAPRQKLTFVGYAPVTEYTPFRSVEQRGSFKRGKHWVHRHGSQERGNWPRVYRDQAGNYIYEPGGHSRRSGKATYRIGKWLYA